MIENLLASGPILPLLKIVALIAIPSIALAAISVILVHYLKKKKKEYKNNFQDELIFEQGAPPAGEQQNIVQKYEMALLKERALYQKEIRAMEERCRLLIVKRDNDTQTINQLEKKLKEFPVNNGDTYLVHDKMRELKESAEQKDKELEVLQQKIGALDRQLARAADETKGLKLELGQITTLENENKALNEKLHEWENKYHHTKRLYEAREEELSGLKGKLDEQHYTENMLTERNNRIEFLQKQLEQRTDSLKEIEQTNYGLNERVVTLESELKDRMEENHQKADLFNTRLRELQEKERQLQDLTNQNEQLCLKLSEAEHQVTAMRDQELRFGAAEKQMQAGLEEKNKMLDELQNSMEEKEKIIGELENKLKSSTETFLNMYREVSRSYVIHSRLLDEIVPVSENRNASHLAIPFSQAGQMIEEAREVAQAG